MWALLTLTLLHGSFSTPLLMPARYLSHATARAHALPKPNKAESFCQKPGTSKSPQLEGPGPQRATSRRDLPIGDRHTSRDGSERPATKIADGSAVPIRYLCKRHLWRTPDTRVLQYRPRTHYGYLSPSFNIPAHLPLLKDPENCPGP